MISTTPGPSRPHPSTLSTAPWESLDADQRAALELVLSAPPVVQLRATAGSGKTRTLVATIAALIAKGVPPEEIVATTFTNKAAKELDERLSRVLRQDVVTRLRIGTFHKLALNAMREIPGQHWHMDRCLETQKAYGALPSSSRLWWVLLTWAKDGIPGTHEPCLGIQFKDTEGEPISPGDYALEVDNIRADGHDYGSAEAEARGQASDLPSFLKAWGAFERAKEALGMWDFADVLAAWKRALQDPASKARRARFVLVDEAQDNSRVQLEIARLLTQGEKQGTLALIGDSCQAIYQWRGAAPEVFLGAEADLGAVVASIPCNYRSGSRIVAAGNAIIAGEAWSLDAQAKASRDAQGSIEIFPAETPWGEAALVADDIVRRIQAGSRPEAFAILVRTNAAAGAFEGACLARSIPVARVGGVPFWERSDTVAYLSYAALVERESWEAFERIVDKPSRKLGQSFLQAVGPRFDRGASLPDAIAGASAELYNKRRDAALDLARTLRKLRGMTWPAQAKMIADLLAAGKKGAGSRSAPDEDVGATLAVCTQTAEAFGSACDLIDYATAAARNSVKAEGAVQGRVTIATVHRVKGLEYDDVYVSCTAGIFPHARSEGNASRMEEERRLFYVAVTRARNRLILTHSETDAYGEAAGPSPFIELIEGI